MTLETPSLDINAAVEMLRAYSLAEFRGQTSEIPPETLAQALTLLQHTGEYLNLGVCATSTTEAIATLRHYLQAWHCDCPPELDQLQPLKATEEGVYLKFNQEKQKLYLSEYDGKYRGVLVAYHGEQEALQGTYGHFPLDLFSPNPG